MIAGFVAAGALLGLGSAAVDRRHARAGEPDRVRLFVLERVMLRRLIGAVIAVVMATIGLASTCAASGRSPSSPGPSPCAASATSLHAGPLFIPPISSSAPG